jgi:hypothetical protein
VRFIALDTNPIVDPGKHYSREVQVKYSDEEFTWLVKRVQEHTGPVFVMMHHPPFSIGFHRDEWQRDSVLSERRERMMRALHESGIAVIVSGHEHAYQRAILTWPDAVAIMIATGGGGAPLHAIPQTPVGSQMFAQYHVAGAVVKPENVYTNPVFHFVLMRLWFGGGELYAYSVDAKSHTQLIDKVQIDLKRWGVPKIDQKRCRFRRPRARRSRRPTRTKRRSKRQRRTRQRRIADCHSPSPRSPRQTRLMRNGRRRNTAARRLALRNDSPAQSHNRENDHAHHRDTDALRCARPGVVPQGLARSTARYIHGCTRRRGADCGDAHGEHLSGAGVLLPAEDHP